VKQTTKEIFSAVLANDVNEVILLLDSNPSLVEARDKEGNTPLHFAQSVAMANKLLGYKADPKALNNKRFSPDETAWNRGQEAVQKAILRGWPEQAAG